MMMGNWFCAYDVFLLPRLMCLLHLIIHSLYLYFFDSFSSCPVSYLSNLLIVKISLIWEERSHMRVVFICICILFLYFSSFNTKFVWFDSRVRLEIPFSDKAWHSLYLLIIFIIDFTIFVCCLSRFIQVGY